MRRDKLSYYMIELGLELGMTDRELAQKMSLADLRRYGAYFEVREERTEERRARRRAQRR